MPRPKVIGFVRYYTVSQEQWIFAGAYEVNKKSNFNEIKEGVGYDLKPIPEYQNLYGRLVVEYKNTTQQLKKNAENVLKDIKVVEILKKPYNGVEFEGYNNINLTFQELEVIIKNNVDEWKRWSDYIYSNNGGNKEMLQLDNNYIRDNFTFTLLEWYALGMDFDFIIARENYWKKVMLSRKIDGYGYNDN